MSRAELSLQPQRNDQPVSYPHSRNELQINTRSTGPSPVHSSNRSQDRNRTVSPILGFPGAAGPLLDSPMSAPGPYFGSSEQSSRLHQSRFQEASQQQHSQSGGSRAPSARSSSADRYGYSERGGYRDYRETDVERAYEPRDDPASRYSSGRSPQQSAAQLRDMQMQSAFGGPDQYGCEMGRNYVTQATTSSQNGNGNYKLRSRSFDEYNLNAPPNVPPQVAQYGSYQQNPGGPLNPPLNPAVHQPAYLGSASYTANMPPSQLSGGGGSGGGAPPPMPLAAQSAGFSGSAPSVALLNQPPPGGGPHRDTAGAQFQFGSNSNMPPFGLSQTQQQQQCDPQLGEPSVQYLPAGAATGAGAPRPQQYGLPLPVPSIPMARYGPGAGAGAGLALASQSSIEATMLEYQAEIANLHGYLMHCTCTRKLTCIYEHNQLSFPPLLCCAV